MPTTYEHEPLNDLLAQWMKDFGPRILLTIRSRGVPPGDAEDVMQEAFVKACQLLRNGQLLPTHPEGWLKTIAIHVAVDYLRKRGAEARCRERLGKSGKVRDSYCPSTENDQASILGKLLALLDGEGSSVSSLRVVERRVFDGWTFAQIAAQFGVTDVTARRWYHLELQLLRQTFEDQGIKSMPEQS